MTKILIDIVVNVALALISPEPPAECQDAVEQASDVDASAFTDNCREIDGRVTCDVFSGNGVVLGACDGTP